MGYRHYRKTVMEVSCDHPECRAQKTIQVDTAQFAVSWFRRAGWEMASEQSKNSRAFCPDHRTRRYEGHPILPSNEKTKPRERALDLLLNNDGTISLSDWAAQVHPTVERWLMMHGMIRFTKDGDGNLTSVQLIAQDISAQGGAA